MDSRPAARPASPPLKQHPDGLQHLYGSATLVSAKAMLRREQRCFGIEAPGMDLKACDLHQQLLAAYAKLRH